ncbi:AraC family transcriptional regulator [Asaia prunellae]|uniref:AraC family transcriptional regulator n=1 Tax=Asaia prunellae TaxID=610245 RepID=UPI000470F475
MSSESKIWPRCQDAEFSIVSTCSVIRAIMGAAWRPLDIHFEHRRGLSAKTLEAYFGVTPRFGKSSNSIVFSRIDLDHAAYEGSRTIDSSRSIKFLERHLTDLMIESEPDDIVEKVVSIIDRYLGESRPTLSNVARDLGLSVRTLQRELSVRTISFGKILRQCRLKRGHALLERGELSLDEIASDLGYSDSTAFSRAFRQWTNVTPRRFVRSDDKTRKMMSR